MLLRSYEKYSNLVSNTSNAMLHQLSFIESLADLTDSLAAILPFSIELKKKYLYEKDVIKRATSLLEQLKEEIALAKIENKIDEKVLERELKSLQRTGDHYPKYLLTLDMDLEADYDGITKINVIDWLLK